MTNHSGTDRGRHAPRSGPDIHRGGCPPRRPAAAPSRPAPYRPPRRRQPSQRRLLKTVCVTETLVTPPKLRARKEPTCLHRVQPMVFPPPFVSKADAVYSTDSGSRCGAHSMMVAASWGYLIGKMRTITE